jgi:thymidylate synthase ThyX
MGSEYTFPVDIAENEKELVSPFFTNMDKHVFALTNLPEVIKGALFSRYSRSDKSVRRLLLDEFMSNKDISDIIKSNTGSRHLEDALSVSRAEEFYQRVLVGFGDDSVAELAGAHIACENVSSIACEALEDSRVGISPLEKSARYLLFDKKVDGKYLWYRDPGLMHSTLGSLYEETMNMIFDLYCEWIPIVMSYVREASPIAEGVTPRAYESATQAKTCDILKNMLPAGRLTNVGIFGNGRAFEYLLTKLYSDELPECNVLAKDIHEELSKVMPAFVKRAKQSEYLLGTRSDMHDYVGKNLTDPVSKGNGKPYLRLVDYDKDGDVNALAAMMYPYSTLSIDELKARARAMSLDQRRALAASYLSKRRDRRDKPGRALENSYYTFETCATYGVYRDIHRHRILTQERQRLGTDLGYDVPEELVRVSLDKDYADLMERVAEVNKTISAEMPVEAQYVVPRSFNMRWYIKLNLREAYHFTELRSSRQGHILYRRMAQEMKTMIEKVHPVLTEYMKVDMNDYALPRLESEKRIDRKLAELDKKQK